MNSAKSKYCLWCGSTLEEIAIGKRTVASCSKRPECQFVDWNNPAPGAHALVELNGGILLVRRSHEPEKGKWCLPGGYMDSCETPAQTAQRELFEESGLEGIIDEEDVLAVMSKGHNDVQIFYRVSKIVGGGLTVTDETDDVRVFREHNLPDNIAFASHEQVIRGWFAAHRGRRQVQDRRASIAMLGKQSLKETRRQA